MTRLRMCSCLVVLFAPEKKNIEIKLCTMHMYNIIFITFKFTVLSKRINTQYTLYMYMYRQFTCTV